MMNRSDSTGEVLNEVTLSRPVRVGVRSVMPSRENGTMIANIDLSRFNARGPEQLEHRSCLDYELDPGGLDAPIEFLLRDGDGAGMLARGNIQALKSGPKQGKTTTAGVWISTLLRGKSGTLEAESTDIIVAHFDTEQHRSSVRWRQRTILEMAGLDPKEAEPRYRVFSLRELPPSDRWEMVKEAIDMLKPDLVFIDGIVDLGFNYMDPDESQEAISELLIISSKYNCAILNVLHQNKSKMDTSMRGFLGTELVNKASEVYQVVQSNGIFSVTQTESRHVPAADFAFSLNPEGLPVMADETPQARGKYLERVQIIRGFMPESGMRYTDLFPELMERFGVEKRTAKSAIKEFLHGGILVKDENNVYHLKKQNDDLFR